MLFAAVPFHGDGSTVSCNRIADSMRAFLVVALASSCAAVAQADDALNFLVMGDWGGSGSSPFTTAGEIATAAGMGKVAAASGSKFALALGDNFYSSGIHGDEHDARFTQTFENVFTADSLKADDFFRVVAGNHDHNGNVTAQIAYSGVSNRWRFDDLYWTFTETAADGASVQVVFIDTVVLSGNASPEECTADGVPGATVVLACLPRWTTKRRRRLCST